MLNRWKIAARVPLLAACLLLVGTGCGPADDDNDAINNGDNNGTNNIVNNDDNNNDNDDNNDDDNNGTLDPSTDCSEADELTEDMISGGMTVAADTCYRVNGRLAVDDGTLTLSPGAILEFGENASIVVGGEGRLNAEGTADAPIFLTGAEELRGHWKGIHIGTVSSDNALDHVVLEYAGGDGWTGAGNSESGLRVTGKAQISNSTFRENANFALQANEDGDISGFSSNTFSNNDAPMWAYPDRIGEMEGTSEFVDNDDNFVRVSYGNTDTVGVDQSWKDIGVPYRIMLRTYIEAPLALEAGVTVEFDEGDEIIVRNEGSIAANGTADAPVTLTGAEQLRGYWKGIHIGTVSSDNVLDHMVLEYAGSDGWTGAGNSEAGLRVTGKAQISNSTFRENANFALQATEDGDISGFSSNTFSNNDAPMRAYPDRIGEMEGTSEFVDNGDNFVRVSYGNTDTIGVDQSWKDIGVPYRIMLRTYIEAALTLEAGVTVEVDEGDELIVRNGGSLHAAGEEGNEVVIRGADRVQGYWVGIHYATNSPQNTLEHTILAEAGGDNWTGGDDNLAAIYMSSDAQLSLDGVTISDSGGYGFLLRGDSRIADCNDVTFENLVNSPVNNETDDPSASCGL